MGMSLGTNISLGMGMSLSMGMDRRWTEVRPKCGKKSVLDVGKFLGHNCSLFFFQVMKLTNLEVSELCVET